jgi:hypothetical protein
MYLASLKHWRHLRELSLREAAMLIAGIDPARTTVTRAESSLITVTQRAIAEAIERANRYAWDHARELDRLYLHSRKNKAEIAELTLTTDIWEISDRYADFLPTIEIRSSVAAVNRDPINVPILLPVDPWYTATVYGNEMNEWLERTEMEAAYLFSDEQRVIVTTEQNNLDARQSGNDQAADAASAPQQAIVEPREPFSQFSYLDAEGIPIKDTGHQIRLDAGQNDSAAMDQVLSALEDVAHTAILFFRGAYAQTPFSIDKQARALPWAQKYLPCCAGLPDLQEVEVDLTKVLPSIKSEIESVAVELNAAWDKMSGSGEFDRPLTYYAPKLMADRQTIMQGLAVEVLGAVDSAYSMLASSRYLSSAELLADAFMHLHLLSAEAHDYASEIEGAHPSLEAMRQGASKGGLRSAETRRLNSPLPSRQELRAERDRLIQDGRSARDVASIFSLRYGRTADYVRKLLRDA